MKKSLKCLSAVLCTAMAFSAAALPASADWETSGSHTVYRSDESGKIVRGFREIGGKTYYFDSKGYMRTGWLKLKSGKSYYFNKDGTMRTGNLSLKNGDSYFFDDDGVMLRSDWVMTEKGNYYYKSSGKMAKSCKLTLNGKGYEFSEKGKAEPIIYNSSYAKRKAGSFTDPEFGMSLKEIINSCGMGKVKKIDERTFSGRVIFSGIDSEILTAFNDMGELYYWQLGIHLPYSSFEKTLNNIKAYDEKVNVKEGVYYWIVKTPEGDLHSNLFLKYDESTATMYYGWSSYAYSD